MIALVCLGAGHDTGYDVVIVQINNDDPSHSLAMIQEYLRVGFSEDAKVLLTAKEWEWLDDSQEPDTYSLAAFFGWEGLEILNARSLDPDVPAFVQEMRKRLS